MNLQTRCWALLTEQHRSCACVFLYFTSFQIGRGSHILKVVHVDDIYDWRNYSGLVLNGEDGKKKLTATISVTNKPTMRSSINIYCKSNSETKWQRAPGDSEHFIVFVEFWSRSKYYNWQQWFICLVYTYVVELKAKQLCPFHTKSKLSQNQQSLITHYFREGIAQVLLKQRNIKSITPTSECFWFSSRLY